MGQNNFFVPLYPALPYIRREGYYFPVNQKEYTYQEPIRILYFFANSINHIYKIDHIKAKLCE